MKLVTSELMRSIDRETIDKVGIPGPELMENAGRGIAEGILSGLLSTGEGASVAIFCGKGNNGGDGYVVGRYLKQAGVGVTVYYLGPADKLSPDARLNYDRAVEIGLNPVEIKAVADLPEQLNADYIIDAVFGTGFDGAPRGLSADIIQYMNSQPQSVIAVDLPSGLNADTGAHEGEVVTAEHTFTLELPKYGFYVSPGRELSGNVRVVPIGVPDEVLERFDLTTELITAEYVASVLPSRKPDGHKGDFGKLFLLAGSTGLTGAAALAAVSALRAGCGLAKVGCPRTVLPVIAASVIEATTMPLPDIAKKGALALRGLGDIRQAVTEHDAVAIGPGLGSHRETYELVRRLVGSIRKPAVIDADGLNALAGHLEAISNASAPMVLTPHPGEFYRLNGVPVSEAIHDRIKTARRFATEHDIVLVLKGSPTLVVDSSGLCALNPTGNNGMATGGSGDVLTGLIGSLLAQGMDTFDAARAGVYLHGLAGDLAADDISARSMIASDMVDALGDAFMAVE